MDNARAQYIARLRHLAFVYSFSLVYLFLFHITMPPKSTKAKKEKAVWNDQETAALIEFLHQETNRTGNSSYTGASFNAVADHIRNYCTMGPAKTGKQCKTKWATVSTRSFQSMVIKLISCDQLKMKWSAADRLASSSGAGSSYSPQTGVNAMTSAEQRVIDDFAASNPVIFSPSVFSF